MSSKVLLIIELVYLSTGLQGLNFQTEETTNCSKPWFVWKNDSCKCGHSVDDIITCYDDPVNVQLQPCYCMTVDNHTGETIVGGCPYSCDTPFHWYPNRSQLNYYMCTDTWKRTGQLCSQCIDGHGPLVHSYGMQCIPCSSEVVRKSLTLGAHAQRGLRYLVCVSVCVCVCVCVYAYFSAMGNEADSERYQRLQYYKRSKNKMAIFLKRPYYSSRNCQCS